MSNQDSLVMMSWFHGRFLAETQGWSLEECGAYFLLLAAQWYSGPLPEDPAKLATIARVTPAEFRKLWKRISPQFARKPSGLINELVQKDRAKALTLRAARQKGAADTNKKL